jgi:hypothetical protein
MCDVCEKVKELSDMNEITRKYRTQNVLFGVTEKQEILHICVKCWDEIKNKTKEADELKKECAE